MDPAAGVPERALRETAVRETAVRETAVPGTAVPESAATGTNTGSEAGTATLRRAISPSRASDFMQCPLLYRFRVVDKLPEPPSKAAARGTLVHAVLEHVFDVPAAQRMPDQAVSLLGPQWDRLVEAEPGLADLVPNGQEQQWLQQAATLVHRWFELEDPSRLEPAERELYVEAEIDGLTLRGYVDRLDVAPTGEIRVVDYKTGRSPSVLFEAKALFQMKFYALVLWRMRDVIPTMLQLVYLGNGELVRYTPDERDLLATERKVAALWRAIERSAQTGDWRPSPSRLCDWCSFQQLCPAFGGTPPPLPQDAALRAVDPRAAGTAEIVDE